MARNLTTGLQRGLRRSIAGGLGAGDLFSTAALDLRFAQQKTLDPRITFTRASSGTYVGSDGLIKTATTNEARFDHNPTTRESLGLLVEEQRTNSLTGSQDFSNTYWNNSNSTRTNNNATAPDSTTTACLVTGLGTTYGGLVRRYITFAASTTYTFSCFAKAGTVSTVGLRLTASCVNGDNYCYYNLTTGVATAITSSAGTVNTVSMTAFPNGWYRCVLTYTTSASQGASDFIDIALTTSTGNHNYTGTGNALIWGAMLESGASFPTSYIPTTTATATRSADVASITGSNFSSWYNQTEGTVFARSRLARQASVAGTGILGIETGVTNAEAIYMHYRGSGLTAAQVFDNSVSQADFSPYGSAVPANTTISQAIAFRANDTNAAGGGSIGTADTTCSMPTPDRLLIGYNSAANIYLSGTIRRLTYWPSRLPNSTLQQITQ